MKVERLQSETKETRRIKFQFESPNNSLFNS